MKVLLTGPCGRVGFTTVLRLLEAGHQVRCFETRDGFITHPAGFNEACESMLRSRGLEYEWVWGDIRNADDVMGAVGNDIGAVIHHAAITLPSQCEEEWEYCWDVNYYGTLNVIDAIKASSNSPKLVYSSSVAVYGFPLVEGQVFTETDLLPSTCTYAATKVASELAIRRSGINYSIMRMASCGDVAAPHLFLNSLPAMQARGQKETRLKMETSPAHFISRDDVNTAYLNALDNAQSDHGIFNIAGPEDCRTTFGSIRKEMAATTGGKPPEKEAWGQKPYPQGYYDISHADDILHYAKTPRAGIMKNLSDSVQEVREFLQFYQSQ
jgi:nucleoside-diphosphate-sugar epimerase